MKRQGGFVLVIVLVVVALTTSLTVLFINDVYLELGSNRNAIDAAQGSLFAQGGITGGLQLLTTTLPSQSYSSLNDLWARPILLDEERGQLAITITDETGKLNLNQLVLPNGSFNEPYRAALVQLLKRLELSGELVETLADWLDADDTPHPGGAESGWYLSQKQAARPRNGYLTTLDELAAVKGFAGTPLERLRPFITVYGDAAPGSPASPVNINTAPREVLEALDERISPELATRIAEHRRLSPFKYPAELAQVPGLETIAPALLSRISTKGTVYRLRADATVNGSTRTVEAIVRLTGGSSTMLYWREF